LRRKVEGARASSLFDIARYCRELEAACVRMWRMAEGGMPPSSFAVHAPEP